MVCMNVAAQHSDRNRIAAQQAAARRFGMAIVTSSLVIAGFAFIVYVRSPSDSLQPHLVSQSGLSGAASRLTVDAQLASLLNTFAQALEREDDAALRSVYPTITPRDARILHQVRARLGTAAHLRVANMRARKLGELRRSS
jgi:hypothetical protein